MEKETGCAGGSIWDAVKVIQATSGHVGSRRVKSSQVGSSRSSPVTSSRVLSGQVESGHVRARCRVRPGATPAASLYALYSEQFLRVTPCTTPLHGVASACIIH